MDHRMNNRQNRNIDSQRRQNRDYSYSGSDDVLRYQNRDWRRDEQYADNNHTGQSWGQQAHGHRYSGEQMGRQSANHGENMLEQMKHSVKNFFGKGPKGYQRSDERIKEDVCDMLYRHPGIDASEIEVFVKGGTVTLSGTIEDRQTKRLVEDLCEECPGVTNVINQLLTSTTGATQGSRPGKNVQ